MFNVAKVAIFRHFSQTRFKNAFAGRVSCPVTDSKMQVAASAVGPEGHDSMVRGCRIPSVFIWNIVQSGWIFGCGMLYFIVSVLFERCLTVSVCSGRKYFLLLWCRGLLLAADISESVFAFVLTTKSDNFKRERTTNSTHFLFRLCGGRFCGLCPISIQVWGIASFIFSWVLSEPRCR